MTCFDNKSAAFAASVDDSAVRYSRFRCWGSVSDLADCGEGLVGFFLLFFTFGVFSAEILPMFSSTSAV